MTRHKGTKKAASAAKRKAKAPAKATVLVLGNATRSIHNAGGKTKVMSYTAGDAAVKAVANVDAVLLTGGGDISPNLYGAAPHPQAYGYNEQRDLTEVLVLEAAAKRGIPVMGICRGHQMLNVAFGGTLHQNIPDLDSTHEYHGGGHDHRVRAAEGSRLAGAWDDGNGTEWVTSIHHQAIDRVADGFVATGWALDGTVEAIEAVDGWMMGVQFHPEMRADDHSQSIFDAFVAAAAKHAGKAAPTPLPRAFQNQATGHPAAKPARQTKAHKAPAKGVSPWRGNNVGVTTRYRCFRCGTPDFDLRVDYTDHMFILHEVLLDSALDEVTA